MKFISTRGDTPSLSFSDAVATGLAPDGGLFLPETLPQFSSEDFARFQQLDYPGLCTAFFRHFATDIDEATFAAITAKSYATFDHADIAPLVPLGENLQVLELFHGPTLAFKDFALQLLGNLYEHQCAHRGQSINVLGATSGDTGAAAAREARHGDLYSLSGWSGCSAAGTADGVHWGGQCLRDGHQRIV